MSKIALSGKKYSGKSTAARFLVKNMQYKEFSFADPLKKLIIDLFHIDSKYLYDPLCKEIIIPTLGVSGRELMTKIGTEMFNVDMYKHLPKLKETLPYGVWVNSIMSKIKDEIKKGTNIVVSDLRMEHELKALKELGFTTVKIERKTDDNISTITNDAHISEAGVECDIIIENDNIKKFLIDVGLLVSK